MSEHFSRREAIKVIGAAAALAGAGLSVGPAAQAGQASQTRKRVLRLAHLTDIHIQPELKADQGMIACLHHVQSLKDKPQLILTGGDSVMDSFESDDARTTLQWNLWRGVLKNECSIPIRSAIGNHDVWGWNKKNSKTTGEEPNYGKKRAIEMLHLQERYYSFDHPGTPGTPGIPGSGWHFIVLDGIQPDGDGYRAFLDEAQFDWLSRDLGALDPTTPVLVLSHIPIVAASAILWASQNKHGDYSISSARIHSDAVKIKDLFAKHPNVKMCLSGHLHSLDRIDYNGVAYLCNGAVSGNWWKGRHKDTDEGYAVIDLYDDGSFEHEYVKYGWKAAT